MNGRFYGAWWQQIDSDWRAKITINAEPTIEADYQISSCIRHADTLHNRRLRWYIVAGYSEINLVAHISIIVTVGLQIDINASLVIASHQEGAVQESGISVK